MTETFEWPSWWVPRSTIAPLSPNQIKQQRLPLGMPRLDHALTGGLPTQGICEISGEAGTGKSQFCIALARTVAAAGGTVYYIYTEGRFPVNRLNQLESDNRLLDNIYVDECGDIPSLYFSVSVKIQRLADALPKETDTQRDPLKLVVIDSIAALFRGEREWQFRTNTLFKMSSILKRLSEEYDFAVVVSNHVTGIDASISPSLGAAAGCCWAHGISLWRTDREKPPDDLPLIALLGHKAPFHRIFRVDRSPIIPRLMIEFRIDQDGIT